MAGQSFLRLFKEFNENGTRNKRQGQLTDDGEVDESFGKGVPVDSGNKVYSVI